MDKDELTQEEIEALLGGASSSGEPAASSARRLPKASGREDRFGAEQIDALRALHERAGDRFAARLTVMLRTAVEMKLTRLQRRTYGQFLSGLERPACCHVVRTTPPSRDLLLDVAPPILYALIARLLGGDAERHAPVRRAMTEIELRLASRIVRLLLDELQDAWRGALNLELEVTRTESDPWRAELLPPSEAVVLVRFELTLGKARGPVNLCIPASVIELSGGKLSANRQTADDHPHPKPSPESVEQVGQAIQNSLVELRVELARTQITAGELIDLGIGDVITTDQRIDQPLEIDVDGHVRLHARPGTFEGQKAIRIEKRIEPSDG